VNPTFTKFPPEFLKRTQWSKTTIHQKRTENTQKNLLSHQDKKSTLQSKFEALFTKNFSHLTPNDQTLKREAYMKFISSSERSRDKARAEKLKRLIPSPRHKQTAKVTVFNPTNLPIPPQVLTVLEKGLDQPTGGTSNSIELRSKSKKGTHPIFWCLILHTVTVMY
jgi:hypothetical protein